VTALFISTVMVNKGYAACNSSQTKIPVANSDCVTGEWQNHSAWSGTWNWSKTKAHCTQWGTVVAEVDIKNKSDKTWTLTENDVWKWHSVPSRFKIRGVSCCWDTGDICYKSEVEPNSSNWLKFKSGSEYGSTKLATNQQKCAFCARYPDTIYCDQTFDDSICESESTGGICSGWGCGTADCTNAFNASSAGTSCTITGQSFTNAKCVLQASCTGNSGTTSSGQISVVDAYALHNCGGQLRVGECP
jgi:hypothetical protein